MCVEDSFAFFELTERPGCQCEHFPSSLIFSFFRTFTFFTCACVSELLVVVSFLSMELQRHTISLTTTEVELIDIKQ